jgi:hypothetical protein
METARGQSPCFFSPKKSDGAQFLLNLVASSTRRNSFPGMKRGMIMVIWSAWTFWQPAAPGPLEPPKLAFQTSTPCASGFSHFRRLSYVASDNTYLIRFDFTN